jgi:ATP sulfurylase
MHKGWSRVVGFHTRNVIHRAHEYIQMKALEITHADGLYVSPVIGPQKPGDFLPGPILKSYQMMIDLGLYPAGKVLIGCFATYPRFCGPREAVFTAICRKNMGCSHFIIGRNHSGVGDYYKDEDYKKLFASLGNIGIVPVFFDAVGYNARKKQYDSTKAEGLEFISGTRAREALLNNTPLPDWYMRELIQNMLKEHIQAKESVFCP